MLNFRIDRRITAQYSCHGVFTDQFIFRPEIVIVNLSKNNLVCKNTFQGTRVSERVRMENAYIYTRGENKNEKTILFLLNYLL